MTRFNTFTNTHMIKKQHITHKTIPQSTLITQIGQTLPIGFLQNSQYFYSKLLLLNPVLVTISNEDI